jgi:hypothetical protein
VTAIVNGLGEEYKGRVNVSIENATKPENAERIHEYGFRSHGLVIFGKNGEVLQKMDGHLLQEADIRSALESVLAGAHPDSTGASTGG